MQLWPLFFLLYYRRYKWSGKNHAGTRLPYHNKEKERIALSRKQDHELGSFIHFLYSVWVRTKTYLDFYFSFVAPSSIAGPAALFRFTKSSFCCDMLCFPPLLDRASFLDYYVWGAAVPSLCKVPGNESLLLGWWNRASRLRSLGYSSRGGIQQ